MNGLLTLEQLKRRYFTITSLFWFASVLPGATLVLFAQARGLDLLEIGFIFGAYGLTIVLLEIPTGGLADTFGRRRVTLVAVGVTLVAQLSLLSAFSFWQFVAFAVIGGMGRALISGAPEAWFVDGLKTLDEEMDIQPPLAQAEVFSTMALAVGTLLGGFLPDLFAFLPPTETTLIAPLNIPILASALCFVLLGIMVFGLMLEPRTPPDTDAPSGPCCLTQTAQRSRCPEHGLKHHPSFTLSHLSKRLCAEWARDLLAAFFQKFIRGDGG